MKAMAAAPSARVDELVRSGRGLSRDAAIELAETAISSGREAEAVSLVADAARRNVRDVSLWQWTALLHRNLDQHEAALGAFRKAAELAPADPLLAHSVARTTLEAGLPSVDLFERAVALAPGNASVLRGRAAARCAAGDIEAAIAELDAVLVANPGWAEGHDLAGQLRWMNGQPENFTLSVERALDRKPDDAQLWRVLLSQLIHAERFEQALAEVERGRAILGDHVVILANEAIALAELRRDEEADALFARLANIRDSSIRVHEIRHLLRSGRVEAAALVAEPLVEGSDAALVWPYLGLAWRLLGDPRWEWLDRDGAFIRSFDLAPSLPSLDLLAETLRALHRSSGQLLDQSPRGGTQTDGNLFQRIDPQIQLLRAAIVETVQTYVDDLPDVDPRHPLLRHRRDRSVRFAGAWSVRLTGAGYHVSHNHPQGWISSAFYVAVPPAEAGAGEEAGWLAFGLPPEGLGLDLGATRTIRPEPGKLVLFPSTSWHGTLPFRTGERMTVAFDVAPPAP
jgi:tetratricopeptide (TPR) repeat protein